MRKHRLLAVLAFAVLGFVISIHANPTGEGDKVPESIALRITRLQLDQSRLQTQAIQLQAQLSSIQQTYTHDQGELDSLKKEALSFYKLDESKWDINWDKLTYIAKPEKTETQPKK